MIFSNEDLYCFAQAITVDAASTNVIDHGAAGTVYGAAAALDIDRGKGAMSPPLQVQVVEDFATLTSLTVLFQTDTTAAFSSPTTIARSEAVPVASLVAGYTFNIDDIPEKMSERYSRLYFDVTGSDATTGKVSAGFVMGRQTNV